MDLKSCFRCIVVTSVVFGVCTAQTWEETPQDVQVEYGSEVVLDCKLSGLIVTLARWVKLSEIDDSSVDLAIGTLENVDWVEVIYDAATGSYQLKLTAVDYSREGRYQCTVANAVPQSYTAKVGVWSPLSSPSVDGEVEESVDVPKNGEEVVVSRTCTASNVKPKADLTWMYSITSDAGRNIVGELPYDFASGSLPDDGVPVGVDNNVVVAKTETENDDGTTDTESALSVTYTSGADSTGQAEENLKIEVKCKAKQTGYVEERDTVSSAVTVSVISRQALTTPPADDVATTTSTTTTTSPTSKGKEEVVTTITSKPEPPTKSSVTSKPGADADTSTGGCTKGCVAGIIIALLVLIIHHQPTYE
ncbi:uncharacterized protein LOC144440400 isoform X2 [Glandiceps talaboti]